MEAAFFDLDKTVIAKASLVAFGRPLYDAGMINRWLVARAVWSNLMFHYLGADEGRLRKFRESALRITRGWDQALVSAIVRDALVEVIEPIVYAEALDLINEHRAAGRRIFIVSASPEEIVAPLAQFLGVDEAIASRAELDDEGRYTGNVEFWSYGPYKAEAIRQLAELHDLDLERSYAYSDSATDLPMLLAVGHPVAVNPDRDLARVARAQGWETRWFEHGVPLRQRVNMPRPSGAVMAAGGAAATVGVGLVVAWVLLGRRAKATPAPAAPPSSIERVRTAVGRATPFGPRAAQAQPATRTALWSRWGRQPVTTARSRRTTPVTRPAASSPRRLRARTGRR